MAITNAMDFEARVVALNNILTRYVHSRANYRQWYRDYVDLCEATKQSFYRLEVSEDDKRKTMKIMALYENRMRLHELLKEITVNYNSFYLSTALAFVSFFNSNYNTPLGCKLIFIQFALSAGSALRSFIATITSKNDVEKLVFGFIVTLMAIGFFPNQNPDDNSWWGCLISSCDIICPMSLGALVLRSEDPRLPSSRYNGVVVPQSMCLHPLVRALMEQFEALRAKSYQEFPVYEVVPEERARLRHPADFVRATRVIAGFRNFFNPQHFDLTRRVQHISRVIQADLAVNQDDVQNALNAATQSSELGHAIDSVNLLCYNRTGLFTSLTAAFFIFPIIKNFDDGPHQENAFENAGWYLILCVCIVIGICKLIEKSYEIYQDQQRLPQVTLQLIEGQNQAFGLDEIIQNIRNMPVGQRRQPLHPEPNGLQSGGQPTLENQIAVLLSNSRLIPGAA